MIRFVLGIFGVAAILCAYVLLPPVADWRIFQTNMAAADQLGEVVDVTRNIEPTFTETGEMLDDGYAFTLDDAGIEETASAVLAGLQAATTEGLTPLQILLVQALRAGQTDTEIDAAINAAAIAGEISVPAVLVTADGRVDTVALLAAIDTAARGADIPTPVNFGTDPVADPVPPQPVADAPVAEVIEVTGPRFHVVAPGDSLGSISTAFFGSPRYDDLIFEANREVLADPNQLRVGQRLVIPEN